MGKTFKRNQDDYDEVRVRESRKEAKIRRRREEYDESTSMGEIRK